MSIYSGVAATAARSKKVVGGGGEAASKEVPRYLSNISIHTIGVSDIGYVCIHIRSSKKVL